MSLGLHSRVFASVVAVGIFLALAPHLAQADGDMQRECISYWGEARFGGVGFNHIVHIANRCETTAVCDVSTDIAPTPRTVTVPGGRTVQVVTYLDSPSSKFTPHVTCAM